MESPTLKFDLDDGNGSEEDWETLEEASTSQHAQEQPKEHNFSSRVKSKNTKQTLKDRMSLWPTFLHTTKSSKKSVTWDKNKPQEFSPIRYQSVQTVENTDRDNDDFFAPQKQLYRDIIETEEGDGDEWESCSFPTKQRNGRIRSHSNFDESTRQLLQSRSSDHKTQRSQPQQDLRKVLMEEPILLFLYHLCINLWRAPEWMHNRVALAIVAVGLLWQVFVVLRWAFFGWQFPFLAGIPVIAITTLLTLVLSYLNGLPRNQDMGKLVLEQIHRVALVPVKSSAARQVLWIVCLAAPVWGQIMILSFLVRIQGEYATILTAILLVAALWGCTGMCLLENRRKWKSISGQHRDNTAGLSWLCLYLSSLRLSIVHRDLSRLSWLLPPLVVALGVGIFSGTLDLTNNPQHRCRSASLILRQYVEKSIEHVRFDIHDTLRQNQKVQVQIMKWILVDSWRKASTEEFEHQSTSSVNTSKTGYFETQSPAYSRKHEPGTKRLHTASCIAQDESTSKNSWVDRDNIFWRALCDTNLDHDAQPVIDKYKRAIQDFPLNRTFSMCISLLIQLPALIAALSLTVSSKFPAYYFELLVIAAFGVVDVIFLKRWLAKCHTMAEKREEERDRSVSYERPTNQVFWQRRVDPVMILILASSWKGMGSLEDVPTMLRIWWNIVDSVKTLDSCMVAARCIQTTAATIDLKRNMHSFTEYTVQVRNEGWLHGLNVLLQEFVIMLDNLDGSTRSSGTSSTYLRQTTNFDAASVAFKNISTIFRNTNFLWWNANMGIRRLLDFCLVGTVIHSPEEETSNKLSGLHLNQEMVDNSHLDVNGETQRKVCQRPDSNIQTSTVNPKRERQVSTFDHKAGTSVFDEESDKVSWSIGAVGVAAIGGIIISSFSPKNVRFRTKRGRGASLLHRHQQVD